MDEFYDQNQQANFEFGLDRNFMLEDIKEDAAYEDEYDFEFMMSKTPH